MRAFVQDRREDLLRLLADLVAIDSTTGRESALAEFCAGWLRGRGVEVELWPCKGRSNLVARVGSGEPTLVLSGHLDTVPALADEWSTPPWTPTLREGRLYGLGASDLKVSIAAAFHALLYFASRELPGRLVAAFTIEEETTGDGTRLFLERALEQGFLDPSRTAAVVTEPSGLERVCLANPGTAFFFLEVRGRGGHGSRPHLARNPLPVLARLLDDLPRLQRELAARHADEALGAATLTPTSVGAGEEARMNVIPEVARAVLDCRVTPGLYADGWRAFDAELAGWLEAHATEGLVLSGERRFARAGYSLPPDHPLARTALAAVREDAGLEAARFEATTSGNDAVFFGEHGIPTIDKLGPGHPECAHRVDEYVRVENLLLGTEVYIHLARRFFGIARAPGED